LGEWLEIMNYSDLIFGEIVPKKAFGKDIIIVLQHSGKISVFTDICSHQDVKLSDFGAVSDGKIICYAHNGAFDLGTGEPLCLPARKGLIKWEVKVAAGRVLVRPTKFFVE